MGKSNFAETWVSSQICLLIPEFPHPKARPINQSCHSSDDFEAPQQRPREARSRPRPLHPLRQLQQGRPQGQGEQSEESDLQRAALA